MDGAFELVVAFDRDSPEFARGVEVGILHQRLRSEPLPVRAIMHVSNVEMAFRLAETHGVTAKADEAGDDWLAVAFF